MYNMSRVSVVETNDDFEHVAKQESSATKHMSFDSRHVQALKPSTQPIVSTVDGNVTPCYRGGHHIPY